MVPHNLVWQCTYVIGGELDGVREVGCDEHDAVAAGVHGGPEVLEVKAGEGRGGEDRKRLIALV